VAARLVGGLVARLGQPRVVGEMLAGLLLGPSALGVLAPDLAAAVFPAASVGFLSALAQVGVLLFMFVVGLELDPAHLREQGHTAVVTSHASIIAPFLLGTALSLALYEPFAPPGVSFAPFALFMGTAMSVTAFPVLARILAERGMTATPLGAIAIACAAVDDVTAWVILAAVILFARTGEITAVGGALVTLAAYLAIMFVVIRPLLARLARRVQAGSLREQEFLAAVVLIALGSAWATEHIGVHALFGAFLAGVLVPRGAATSEMLMQRCRDLLVVLLLPLFFAITGLRTGITLISGPTALLACAAVLVAAVAGKLGGSALAARASGLQWRDALSLGALMNTRGLMELVVLNVGLEIGVLSPTLFAIMVVMALVTTAATSPLLTLFARIPARAARTVHAG
jgi:Kef-type K+ transport system membrane component KefB